MKGTRIALVVVPTVALTAATIVLAVTTGTSLIGFSFSAVLLVAIGALLVVKVPHNMVGMVLLVGGAAWLLYTAAGEYARLSMDSGPFPGEYLAAWLGSWLGALLPASLAALILVFPDGTIPRGWRWLAWVLGLVVLSALVGAVMLWGLPAAVLTDFDALDREPAYLWVDLAFMVGFLAAIPAVASLVGRYRRGNFVERSQIKWLLAVATLLATTIVAGIALFADETSAWEWVLAGSIALVPVAVLFAVLRYRLYAIDRIISRTVTYALVVGLLGLVVLGLAAGLTMFLPSDDPLLVAIATLVAFALFNPLRRRVQRFVDRKFNRARYDAERVMDEFTGSLRDQVDAERVVQGWVGVVEDTMEPAAVGVWVRQ